MTTKVRTKLPAAVDMANPQTIDKLLKTNKTTIDTPERAEKYLEKCGIWPAADTRMSMFPHLERAIVQFAAYTNELECDDTVKNGIWAIYQLFKALHGTVGTNVEKALRIADTLDATQLATALSPLIEQSITKALDSHALTRKDVSVDWASTPAALDEDEDVHAPVGQKLNRIVARLEAATSTFTTSTQQMQPTYAQMTANPASQKPRTLEQQDAVARTTRKEKQLLINAKRDSPRDWYEAAPDAIISRLNKAIGVTVTKHGLPQGITAGEQLQATSIQRLPNGGVVFDLPSRAAADWLQAPKVAADLCSAFGAEVEVKQREFMILIKNLPFDFLAPMPSLADPEASTPDPLRNLETENNIPAHSLIRWSWIKTPERRSPNQRTAHALLAVSTPELANMLMEHKMRWGGYCFTAERLIYDPIRCGKCNLYGHKAADCDGQQTCSRCASTGHLAKECKNAPKCAACVRGCEQRTDHPCFDRDCPTLLFLRERRGAHKPEDTLPRFLTAANVTLAFPPVEIHQQPMPQGNRRREAKTAAHAMLGKNATPAERASGTKAKKTTASRSSAVTSREASPSPTTRQPRSATRSRVASRAPSTSTRAVVQSQSQSSTANEKTHDKEC